MQYQVMLRKEVRQEGELSKIGGDKGAAAACYPLQPIMVTQPHGDVVNAHNFWRMSVLLVLHLYENVNGAQNLWFPRIKFNGSNLLSNQAKAITLLIQAMPRRAYEQVWVGA